jgi:hypothetical protein
MSTKNSSPLSCSAEPIEISCPDCDGGGIWYRQVDVDDFDESSCEVCGGSGVRLENKFELADRLQIVEELLFDMREDELNKTGIVWIEAEKLLPGKITADLGDEYNVYLIYPYSKVCSMMFDGKDFYTGGWGASKTYWTNKVLFWSELPKPPQTI